MPKIHCQKVQQTITEKLYYMFAGTLEHRYSTVIEQHTVCTAVLSGLHTIIMCQAVGDYAYHTDYTLSSFAAKHVTHGAWGILVSHRKFGHQDTTAL